MTTLFHSRVAHSICACSALFFLATSAGAQCPGVRPGFAQPGLSDTVHALLVHDDGSGRALWIGGQFAVDPLVHVTRWDGRNWAPREIQLESTVRALQVCDLGTGAFLYAGGDFVGRSFIRRWALTSWAPLGSGMNDIVSALAAFDDGSGPALYAGGQFTSAGGVPASKIARWNGTSWSAVGGGVDRNVYALAVHDDGSGPALYAAGEFDFAGGVPCAKIARWSGTSWSPLGCGFPCPFGLTGTVRALASFGGALYVGGEFTSAGGAPASHVARWDGGSWSALASGTNGNVYALAVHDEGSGARLFAGGAFVLAGGVAAAAVARWDGSSWSAAGEGLVGDVRALSSFDDGSGNKLFAGGNCRLQASSGALNIARWDGQRWRAVSEGLDYFAAQKAVIHDDGSGPKLFVGGTFRNAGGVGARNIARWTGQGWESIGGVDSSTIFSPIVYGLASFDDGTGPALYVCGSHIDLAGGSVPCHEVARWRPSGWEDAGGSFAGGVFSLNVLDLGNGPSLYAALGFGDGVARWDNGAWTMLPGLVLSGVGVQTLAVYDDGNGRALYAGGGFTVASDGSHNIARWDGSQWSGVGGGTSAALNNFVFTLITFDDGSGSALYAGGWFNLIRGHSIGHLARWNGSSWSAVGATQPREVQSLGIFDDGTGAGGQLLAGVQQTGLRKWNGGSWTTIAAGAQDFRDLFVFRPDPAGPAELWVSGWMWRLGGQDVSGVAVYEACLQTGHMVCFGDGSGTACPCGNESLPSDQAGCRNSTGSSGALRARGGPSLGQDTLALDASGMPPTAPALFVQSTALDNAGLGTQLGDGLRCIAGSVQRLGTRFASGGSVSIGHGATVSSLHVTGNVSLPGSRRFYQAYYRNAASFCTAAFFNFTNSVEIVWEP